MTARAESYRLSLAVAFVAASVGFLGGHALAQDETGTPPASQETSAAPEAAQESAAEQSVEQQPPIAAPKPRKADLDQSAVRAVTVVEPPRPTITRVRAIILPKILGSYR